MSLPNASKKKAKVDRLIEIARNSSSRFKNPMFAEMFAYAVEQYSGHNNPFYLQFLQHLEQPPVSIEEFLDSDDFMGSTDLSLWPEVRNAIIGINSEWWKGPNHAKTEALLLGATGCVDRDTEFLTPIGWKKISEYTEGDLVAQYHEDGSMTFVEPIEYVNMKYPVFLKFKTSSFDQLLTPGHRIIYRSAETGQLQERPAEEIAQIHNSSKRGWDSGAFIGDYSYSGEGVPFTDSEIRLMVAVKADGHFYKSADHLPTYCIFHLKKGKKKKRLRKLLDICGLQYSEYVRQDGYSDIAFSSPERYKTYDHWWPASQHQLQVTADEVLYWGGNAKRGEFYTRDKSSADFIQHVFSATGRRASIRSNEREDGVVDYVVRIMRPQNWSIASNKKKDIELVDSVDGRCYCFKLPTGMWLSRRDGKVVVTGNTGKSEICKVTTAYHMHVLGCLKAPQKVYGIPVATSILFVIQAAKPHVTKKIIYAPLRKYIESMPWFQRHMRPNRLIESEMYFAEKNIRVVPGGSDSDTILGEAIIGGVIDEINFMAIVQRSKKADVGSGRSGVFDQAQSIYDALTRRKKSRFIYQGPQIGVVCVSSSTRYTGDFTDKRRRHVQEHKEKGIYIYDKAQFDVWPQSRYSGERFRIAVASDASVDILVLDDEDRVPDGYTVTSVPIEYKEEFQKDPAGAMRDIIGRAVNSINPFFRQRHKIIDCIELGAKRGLESFLYKDNVVLGLEGMPVVKRGHYCQNPSKPRYVHIDLSATGDRCGIAMLRFEGMVDITRSSGIVDTMPAASVEMAVTIQPDHGAEIDISEVRAWVHQLRKAYGYPIRAVTYDGWSSLESRQQWKKVGMTTGLVSVDRTSVPYKTLRDAIYDGRIYLYDQEVLVQELYDLEYDEEKDKVDHPISSCFTGETEILTPQGLVPIRDLVGLSSVQVYTYDAERDVFYLTDGYNPRMEKEVEELIELDLDGNIVRCTPDHRFMLEDSSWVEAQDLKTGDEIKSLPM